MTVLEEDVVPVLDPLLETLLEELFPPQETKGKIDNANTAFLKKDFII